MKQVEAVAAFANEKEGAPGEDGRDRVGTAEAKDESREDRGHEDAVDKEVWRVENEGVEEDCDHCQADCREDETLALGQDQSMLQFAEGDAAEEGAGVGEGGVLKEADELSGAVTIDGNDDVIGVQVEIKGVGDEANDPEGYEEKNELAGLFGPGQADEPRESQIEDALAGEGPGDGVPESGNGRTPTLEDEGGKDDSLPELVV